jgi:hypothetical protein
MHRSFVSFQTSVQKSGSLGLSWKRNAIARPSWPYEVTSTIDFLGPELLREELLGESLGSA